MLLAARKYPSVDLIPPGMTIESTIMADAFNDDTSFYILPSYGYYTDKYFNFLDP